MRNVHLGALILCLAGCCTPPSSLQACPRSLFQNLPNVSLKTKYLESRQGEPDFERAGFGLRMQVSAGMEGVSRREPDDLGQHW